MQCKHEKCVKRALDLSKKLTILADNGDMICADDGLAVLCGIIRDCAYKIRDRSEFEKNRLMHMGQWTDGKDEDDNGI